MSFNPLKEKGMPLEKQIKDWKKLNVTPYDKKEVHPYTRCRVITMNGAEIEAAFFGHQFSRHMSDMDLKRECAMIRRVEQQQQKVINWLTPHTESALEVTIGYEQVAVDLTAFLARHEPDPYVKATFNFGLLEDFDHLYRYANLLDMTKGIKAETLVGKYTEITPGRPTVSEHRHPFDDVRKHYDARTASIQTMLNTMILLAAEQQTMNFYMNLGNRADTQTGRGLYQEIAMIEEQHVTQYESLIDPTLSWFKMDVMHHYSECYLYYSFMEQEVNPEIKKIWREFLDMEIEHLRLSCEMYKKHEKKDPHEFLPSETPQILAFESNIDYIRKVMAEQTDYTANGTDFVPGDTLNKEHRYHKYQSIVNASIVPSQEVIREYIEKNKKDYRLELKGEHPVQRLRTRDKVVK